MARGKRTSLQPIIRQPDKTIRKMPKTLLMSIGKTSEWVTINPPKQKK